MSEPEHTLARSKLVLLAHPPLLIMPKSGVLENLSFFRPVARQVPMIESTCLSIIIILSTSLIFHSAWTLTWVCRMPYAVCRMPYAVCRMPLSAPEPSPNIYLARNNLCFVAPLRCFLTAPCLPKFDASILCLHAFSSICCTLI